MLDEAARVTAYVSDCRRIDLPRIHDPRGNLTVVEAGEHVPFEIRRVYYLYDVPGGASRAGHAHIGLQQFIIAVSGSFDVVVDDGRTRTRFFLNRSYYGLYIPAMIWREIENFSSGSVCLALASTHYDATDYYREYEAFQRAVEASG
jgi:glyoxylate utilization-related uncharacterized protein